MPERVAEAEDTESAVALANDGSVDLDDHSLYLNREVELLKFQERVLEEAEDPANPLLERVKFLAIFGSNVAEFYMVRVAGLRQMVEAGVTDISVDGLSAREQLELVRQLADTLLQRSRVAYLQLRAELSGNNIYLHDYSELDAAQRINADDYYDDSVFPVLTPLAFDPGRPFPHISNLSTNLAVLVRSSGGEEHFARVKVPTGIPRLFDVGPQGGGKGLLGKIATKRERHFVWLDQIIMANLDSLFPGMEVLGAHLFRVTRDADMEIQELEADDLLETIEEGVRRRRFGRVVRVTITPDMPEIVRRILRQNLEINEDELVVLNPPLGFSDLMCLYDVDRQDLKYPPFVPTVAEPLVLKEKEDVFSAIRHQDILLHRPFESFDPIVDLVRTAARDSKVLAIKMTLYRVGRNSPIVEALLDAAREGKEVTALVELKARFDEESNIDWARALEAEGVHVVYGFPGLKIHSKLLLIVRRKGGSIRRYVHVGTGNYNTSTASQYTDLDLLTANKRIAEDASELFNALTGYAAVDDYKAFFVSPHGIRRDLEALIRREMDHAAAGRRAYIALKTNSLTDGRIMHLLYEASMAGVEIDLIVRGICCLRPGVPGISETIRVRSIVGRFLEHTRICYFANDGSAECLIGSADLMGRNLDRRVEIMTPVFDEQLVERLKRILDLYLADNVKARLMDSDGQHRRVPRQQKEDPIDAQSILLKESGAMRQ
jgi:polyphosphate kinase